jgi:hypothetical protein
MEHSRVVEKAEEATDLEDKGIYTAEAARWAWPIGSEGSKHLSDALEISKKIQDQNPDGARLVAEEVRASIFSTRTGSPGHPEILAEANALIVASLSKRDALNEKERSSLAKEYAKQIGPDTAKSLLSSIGFLLWIGGLGVAIWAQNRKRQLGLLISLTGLTLYLGFIGLA